MGSGATTVRVVLTLIGARVTLAPPVCSDCAKCPAAIGVQKIRSSICLRSRSSEVTAEVSVLVTTFEEFSSEQVVADGALALPMNSGCAKCMRSSDEQWLCEASGWPPVYRRFAV